MLKVRFAEVSRSAMQELGATYLTANGCRSRSISRTTPAGVPAPIFDEGQD